MSQTNAGSECRIGYVLKRFPRFSETFIVNELLELQRLGRQVEVFSLLEPADEPSHALLDELAVPVTYLPRGSVVSKWNLAHGLAAGELSRRNISTLGTESGKASEAHQALVKKPFAELMPGKSSEQIAHLCAQATTLAMLVSARGVQHLHAHFASNATTVALLAARMSGVSYSFTAHARDIYHQYVDPQTDQQLLRLKINEAAFVATVSDYNLCYLQRLAAALSPAAAAKTVKHNASADADKVRRLYNGINLQRFTPVAQQKPRQRLIAVGRLVEKKGFTYLIEACRVLRTSGYQFDCLLIGEGPEREALQAQINTAGLQDTVQLPGVQPQEQLIKTLAGATAVVLPCIVGSSGDRDGLPTVLLEAMAMALPTVSTRVAGIAEIIEHGVTGLLAEPGDAVALANCLAALFHDPDNAIQMGQIGREKAEWMFDLQRNVAQLSCWFNEAIGKAAAARFDQATAECDVVNPGAASAVTATDTRQPPKPLNVGGR